MGAADRPAPHRGLTAGLPAREGEAKTPARDPDLGSRPSPTEEWRAYSEGPVSLNMPQVSLGGTLSVEMVTRKALGSGLGGGAQDGGRRTVQSQTEGEGQDELSAGNPGSASAEDRPLGL